MKILKVILGTFLSFIFLSVFVFFVFGSTEFFLENKNLALSSVADSIKPELELTATSAVSAKIDFSNQDEILFEKNISTRLPIASLTKLMTAVIALDNYDLSDKILINEIADAKFSPQDGLRLGKVLPMSDFLHIMIIGSSNKSAFALADKIGQDNFVILMNRKAKELGMTDTYFEEPTGLSENNYSTAKDLVKLVSKILSEKRYSKIIDISRMKQFYLEGSGLFENTNQLLDEMPDIIGGKTGFTDEAKGCLILITYNEEENNYLVHLVLGADDRFYEMKKIINWVNL